MPRCADITVTPTKIELDATWKAKFVVTATNTLGRRFDAAVRIEPEGSTPAAWIDSDVGRFAFGEDKTQAIEISFRPPRNAPAGTYSFHVQIVDLGNPDEYYDNSETLTVELPAQQQPSTSWFQRNRWLVLAIAGGSLLIAGGVTAAVLLTRCDSRKDTACGSCGGKVQCDGTCSVETPASFDQPCGSCGGKTKCDGTCSVETPTSFDQPCGSCGGKTKCDGSCSVATPGNFGAACGSCGGKVQCDGSCSGSPPTNLGAACGSCGGKVQCDGSCSVPTPPGFDQPCGSCGGKTRCDGSCSVPTPATFGAACGSCGGKVLCDASCSVPTPGNLGATCGSCGGKVQCGGSCSVPTPGNLGATCGSCGGKVQCDGSCSVATPSSYNSPCGSCGGRILCNGGCSVATPPDLGRRQLVSDNQEQFTCCFVNYNKPFGRPCSPGYKYAGVQVNKLSGGGSCDLQKEGNPYDCGVLVNFHNNGTDGASCQVVIYEERVCK